MKNKNNISRQRSHVIDDLKDFRDELGPVANDYTPTELRRLREDMRAMAELLLEFLLAQKRNPPEKTIKY